MGISGSLQRDSMEGSHWRESPEGVIRGSHQRELLEEVTERIHQRESLMGLEDRHKKVEKKTERLKDKKKQVKE